MAGNRPEITAAPQDWELCKENFQPIKAGRKPAGLKDPIAISGSASLEEQRQ